MSEYHEKFSTIKEACAGLNLTLHERAPDAHLKLKVDVCVLEHIRFQLEIVDKTVNMSHETSHRMLVDPIVCGAAFVLEDVFLWPEHSKSGKVSVANGATVHVRGSFDYAASRATKLGHNYLYYSGYAKPDFPFCVVVEVKKGAEMSERFGQILIEMKVVQAATQQTVVNGVYTDGNEYYFLRLDKNDLFMSELFFRNVDLEAIFLLTQVALKGDSFWIEKPVPGRRSKKYSINRCPDGTRVITTTTVIPADVATPPLSEGSDSPPRDTSFAKDTVGASTPPSWNSSPPPRSSPRAAVSRGSSSSSVEEIPNPNEVPFVAQHNDSLSSDDFVRPPSPKRKSPSSSTKDKPARKRANSTTN